MKLSFMNSYFSFKSWKEKEGVKRIEYSLADPIL
jgi:hypothetical protein